MDNNYKSTTQITGTEYEEVNEGKNGNPLPHAYEEVIMSECTAYGESKILSKPKIK